MEEHVIAQAVTGNGVVQVVALVGYPVVVKLSLIHISAWAVVAEPEKKSSMILSLLVSVNSNKLFIIVSSFGF